MDTQSELTSEDLERIMELNGRLLYYLTEKGTKEGSMCPRGLPAIRGPGDCLDYFEILTSEFQKYFFAEAGREIPTARFITDYHKGIVYLPE